MTIEEFIEARLAEDEASALAAATQSAEWRASRQRVDGGPFEPPESATDDPPWMGTHLIVPDVFEAEGQHIARHDPARVLVEIGAKRHALWFALAAFAQEAKIQERPGRDPETNAYDKGRADTTRFMLRVLASPYVEHPDYQQEWKL